MYNWSIMGLSDLVIGQSVFFGVSVQTFCSDSWQRPCFCWSSRGVWGRHRRALMALPHSRFHFQEVDVFQRADKEPGCGGKFPLLHHWPKWKQSAHSRPTLWFPLPIPQTCQVWGGGGVTPFTNYWHVSSAILDDLLAVAVWKDAAMLLTCSCSVFLMCFSGKEKWRHQKLQHLVIIHIYRLLKQFWIQLCPAIRTNYSQHINF